MARLEAIISVLSRWLVWVAAGAVVALMLLSVGNIIARLVWRPWGATAEVVGWIAALVTASALAYTQQQKGHTRVDILVSRFPLRVQSIIDSIMFLIGTAFFGVATWRLVELAGRHWELGSRSPTFGIVFFPLIYVVALGCAFLCLVLLLDFLKSVVQAVRK